MSPQEVTKTFTAMLAPDSPRVASYLWLTHRLWNHQLEFVVDEYLNLRRAAEIARAGGDIERATERMGIEGRAAVNGKFARFVKRFQDAYSLTREDGTDVALKLGEMSDYFLVAPKEEGGKDKWPLLRASSFTEQLTAIKDIKRTKNRKEITEADFEVFSKRNENIGKWLCDFHNRGILLFERNARLLNWHRLLMERAAEHVRSQGELRKMREAERESWRQKRTQFIEENSKFFRERHAFFEAYEEERKQKSQEILSQTQPGKQVKDAIRIRGYMIKGISSVLSAWSDEGLWKSKKPVEQGYIKTRIERRKAIFHELRSAEIEKFGDHVFFEWLAEHADDWPDFADDLKTLLDYNSNYLDDRMPKPIGFSRPSFDKHPNWYTLEECFEGWPEVKHYTADLLEQMVFMRIAVPKSDTIKERGNDRWNPDSANLPPLTEANIENILENPSLAAVVPVNIRFKPDSRLKKFVTTDESPEREKEWGYKYLDQITHERYPFRLGGIKLVFRPRPVVAGKSRPYVYFSAKVEMPFEKPRRTKKEERIIEPGTRVLAIDLGHRHRAFGAIREYDGQGKDVQIWAGSIKPPGGRHLSHVDSHEESHRQKRSASQKSATGKMKFLKRGQEFDKEFRNHITNLKDDIAKQTANAIIQTAIEHGASIIVMEMLDGYKPQTDRTRRENRRLRTTAFRALYHELSSDKGKNAKNAQGIDRAGAYAIAVYSYPASYTSRVCHKCGWPGVRFSEISASAFINRREKDGVPLTHRKAAGKTIVLSDVGKVLIQPGGKLFCCSNHECEIVKINADYNAAQNLLRQFIGEKLIEVKGKETTRTLTHPSKGQLKTKEFWKKAEESAQTKLISKGFTLAGLTKPDNVVK